MYTQFNYYSYLQKKYGVDTPTTMLKVEAEMMGIKYPLVHGWREKHRNWLLRDLNHEEREAFLAGLIRKKKATQKEIEKYGYRSKNRDGMINRLASLQVGIDFILGRDFSPVNREDKKLIEEEING
jgi:hypothetical protein